MKKYHLTNISIKHSLSTILSSTRQKTTAFVKFWKHLGQIAWERIPLLPHLFDLWRWQWLVSQVRIPRWSLSYRWRITLLINETIIGIIILIYNQELYHEAKHNIKTLLFNHEIPNHISYPTIGIMVCIIIGFLSYIFFIKTGDIHQAINEHNSENNE